MDDPGPALDIILKLVLLFVLIFFNAFFAMSEIAIISLNDTKMQKLAEEDPRRAIKKQSRSLSSPRTPTGSSPLFR